MDRANFGFPACSREILIEQSCRLFATYANELQIVSYFTAVLPLLPLSITIAPPRTSE